MSQSVHKIAIDAQDRTGGAFSSIASRAGAAGNRIRGMLGGALAAATAYLSFRSVAQGVNELGHLSDIAQKTGTNVSELTKTASALNVLGIQNMGVEQMARAFDYMQKSTGRTGLDGFLQTIAELGKIEDSSARAKEAIKIFGRSGMEFMPLINAATDGTAALETVINAMPGVSQAAADNGDAAADSVATVTSTIKTLWLEALGAIAGMFGDSMREGALNASAWLEFWAKNTVDIFRSVWTRITGYSDAIGSALGAFVGTSLAEGASWSDVFTATGQAWDDSLKNMDIRLDDYEDNFSRRAEELQRKLEANKGFQAAYEAAAVSPRKNGGKDGQKKLEQATEEVATKLPAIRNSLITSGSSEALRLATFGPTLQNETKKQTKLLEKIAANTEQTAQAESEPLNTLD